MTANRPRFDVTGQLTALRRYARSLTRSEVDAEDLVQDALVRAYEKRASFAAGRGMRAWLFAILHNTFIDRRRSRQAEDVRIERSGELTPLHQEASQDQHVRLDQVRRAFMDLPEEQRAALHLVAIEDLTYAEAAANLGIPVGTLMSRLARARTALRAIEDGPAAAAEESVQRRHLKIVGGGNGPVG